MAFLRRKIRVTFTLTEQKTFKEGGDRVVIENRAVSARISKAGGPYMGRCSLQIWGLTLSLMNQLATLGVKYTKVPQSHILVEAGSDQPGDMAAIFMGSVVNCWGDFDAAPDVPMNVEANAVLPAAVVAIKPTSFPESTDVATAISGLATQMGLGFENNGVTTKAPSSYLDGSAWDQAKKIADAGGVEIVQDLGKVVIWPKDGSRGGLIPTVSPSTGMIGYPTFTHSGIMVRTEFNRGIALGGKIKVEGSILEVGNGTWHVYGVDHHLDAELPNGKWESLLQTSRIVGDQPPPPVLPK